MSDDAVFPAFAKELLSIEDKRRESLEARGSSAITVSATLVTLLVALSAFVTNRQGFKLSQATRAPLSVALSGLLPEYWPKGRDFAQKKVTVTRLEQLAALQRANDWRARALLAAVVAQLVAVAALAWAVLGLL